MQLKLANIKLPPNITEVILLWPFYFYQHAFWPHCYHKKYFFSLEFIRNMYEVVHSKLLHCTGANHICNVIFKETAVLFILITKTDSILLTIKFSGICKVSQAVICCSSWASSTLCFCWEAITPRSSDFKVSFGILVSRTDFCSVHQIY